MGEREEGGGGGEEEEGGGCNETDWNISKEKRMQMNRNKDRGEDPLKKWFGCHLRQIASLASADFNVGFRAPVLRNTKGKNKQKRFLCFLIRSNSPLPGIRHPF